MTSETLLNENISLQVDEIEALTSIYGKEWKICDPYRNIYSIDIGIDTAHRVNLQITLSPEYPLEAPPCYQLSAPWMKREAKCQLSAELEDIYCCHTGESILYMWIEKVREFVRKQVDVVTQKESIPPPEIVDYSVLSESEENKDKNGTASSDEYELAPIQHGEPIVDRHSSFQAHLAAVVSTEQVKQILSKLKENRKIASATHNIYAYRICHEPQGLCYQDCDDDGETRAGSMLLHLLQILDVRNVLVVVSRWYGGILLGPDRFKHISNVARTLLNQCGYIQDQKEKDKKKK